MIHVIATIELEPGRGAAYVAEFAKIVPVVRAEPGCIEYTPAIDAAAGPLRPNKLGPDRIVVIEKWASLDELVAHDGSLHMAAFRARVKDLVRAREVWVLMEA